MPNENLKRLAPLTGALAIVLVVVSFLVQGEPPSADDRPREIAEWYLDHEAQTAIAAAIASLGAVALLFFGATVRRALRRSEQEMGVLSMAALAGAVVASAGIATDSALRFTLGQSAEDISPEGVQTIHALWEGFFFPMVVGLGTLVLAVSIAALRTRVVHPVLAWAGIAAFVVLFTPAGFIGFIFIALWTIVLSIRLWLAERRGVQPAVA